MPETSRIIEVIDEIAFQNSILALNAALEAASGADPGAVPRPVPAPAKKSSSAGRGLRFGADESL